jgi:hypothetical protein
MPSPAAGGGVVCDGGHGDALFTRRLCFAGQQHLGALVAAGRSGSHHQRAQADGAHANAALSVIDPCPLRLSGIRTQCHDASRPSVHIGIPILGRAAAVGD